MWCSKKYKYSGVEVKWHKMDIPKYRYKYLHHLHGHVVVDIHRTGQSVHSNIGFYTLQLYCGVN